LLSISLRHFYVIKENLDPPGVEGSWVRKGNTLFLSGPQLMHYLIPAIIEALKESGVTESYDIYHIIDSLGLSRYIETARYTGKDTDEILDELLRLIELFKGEDKKFENEEYRN